MAHPAAPSFAVLGAVLALVVLALTFAASLALSSPLERIAAERLKLKRASIQRLAVDRGRRPFAVPVELGGRRVTLRLVPAANRAADFQVLVQGEDGALRTVTPPAPRTYRGSIDELPGTIVGASVGDQGLTAAISLADGPLYFVEPAREADPTAETDLHVVYLASDAEVEGACMVAEPAAVVSPAPGFQTTAAAPKVADIAVDADYEFYQLNGSSVSATVSDVEAVINGVNVVYQRDCEITHRIRTVIVRSNATDPYSATSASGLYEELRAHWNTLQTAVQRDVVHLMTGKNLDGNVIGYAGVGVVCSSTRAFGLVQSRYGSSVSMSLRVALSAHELGHNWNATHCDASDPCQVMCSMINGCDGIGLPTIEPMGAQAIRSFAASRTCLDTPMMAVDEGPDAGRVQLAAPAPSPFATQTQLRFQLAAAGPVSLDVYDVAGHRVARLLEGVAEAGWNIVTWNGTDASGRRLGAGVFYARIESGGDVRTQKLVLVR